MNIPVDAVLALLGAAVAVSTFFIGRLSAARTTGAEWGRLKADIGHIMRDVADLKSDLLRSTTRQDKELCRLDERLDEHLLGHRPH